MPGRMPMAVPMSPERMKLGSDARSSVSDMNRSVSLLAAMMTRSDRVSISANACATTNRPIMAGTWLMPLVRTEKPRVLRSMLLMGSTPTVEKAMPSAVMQIPLVMEPPERLMTAVNPNSRTAVFSMGPNFSANRATCGASAMRKSQPMKLPARLAVTPAPRALPARPCLASANPSSTVTIEDGVPGIPSSTAATTPPEMPPMYTPTSILMPCVGSRP